tara:strand:- start:375 stop:641 length:267 start_codon:yes stop_codon:yes gene_type:complete
MGEIIGFVCSKCNYEKSYFLGVGFNDLNEKNLYECNNCKTLKASVLSKPKCSKCKQNSLIKIDDYEKNFNCPKCHSKNFNFGISGCWD